MKSKAVARAFGRVLREARTARGMSQDDLAGDAELSRTYPSLLERGLREPTLSVLIQLAHALHCAPTVLVDATLAQLPAHATGPAGGTSPDRASAGRAPHPSPPRHPSTGRSVETAAAQPPPPIRPHRAHNGPRLRRAA